MDDFLGNSRFLAKLPYRGWSWQETNLTHKMALFLAKGLARIMAHLRTEFVSCQLHPLYGSLARNRRGTHEFVHRPSSIVYPPAASLTRLRHGSSTSITASCSCIGTPCAASRARTCSRASRCGSAITYDCRPAA